MAVNRQGDLPACVRHPDRPTGLRCVRCDRPSCPDCLREASVGYQCVDCVAEGQQAVRASHPAPRQRRAARRDGLPALVIVPVLIAVNVLAFVATAVQAGSVTANERSTIFLDGTLVPAFVSGGEWWRLVTSGFLHLGNYGGYGPVHLIFNMFALWVIGRDLEVALGRGRFLGVYLLSLLGGSTAVMLFGDPGTSVAGASGAVYGLFGGIAVVVFRSKLNPAPVLTLIGINVFLSITLPGISLLGHIGGLVAGALATTAMVYAPRERRREIQLGAAAALVVVMIIILVVRSIALDCDVISSLQYICFST